MGIPQMLIKMYVLLHLLLSKLHPVSRLVVILPIHIMDVNNSIWSQFGVCLYVPFFIR
jgi:hypothetical protein